MQGLELGLLGAHRALNPAACQPQKPWFPVGSCLPVGTWGLAVRGTVHSQACLVTGRSQYGTQPGLQGA